MDDEERARYERIAEGAAGSAEGARELARARRRRRGRPAGASSAPRWRAPAPRSTAPAPRPSATSRPSPSIPPIRPSPRRPAGRTPSTICAPARASAASGINEWRKRVPIRAIAFEPPRLPDGRDAPEVVQVHLEHRLVRRLLSRFLSQGFQSGLSRISVIEGPGAQPRVVLMGRLAVYGAGAARLHEEIIPVTAIWTEAERDRKPLRPLGESGEERTLNQLEEALRDARAAPKLAVARVQALVERDIADLLPTLERLADERLAKVKVQLAKRGEAEAHSLAELLEQQRKRIAKASAEFDPNQLLLPVVGERRAPRARGRPSPLAGAARAPRDGNPRRAGAHPRLL